MTHLLSIALHNVVVAMFLALLVFCVTRILKNPPVAHLLWLLVLVKLVTPPLVNFDLWTWGSRLAQRGSEPSPSSATHRPIADASQRPMPSSPLNARNDFELNRVESSEGTSAADNSRPVATVQPRVVMPEVWSAIRPLLMWTWIGGAGLAAVFAGLRILQFQRVLAGTLPASQRLYSVVNELAIKMGLSRSPDVRVVESATAPLVWCLGGRATVVLPLRLLGALDEHQSAMVLAHELAHLRRRDHWVRVIELVVSVLYWWNPLVWWVRRRLHAAEEQCCDAWVAWAYPDHSHDYAQSLLKAAELLPSCSSLAVLASPFLNTHTLKERIELVLTNCSQRAASRSAVVLLALVAAVVIPAGIRAAAERPVRTGDGFAEAPLSKEATKTAAGDTRPKKTDEKPSDVSAAAAAVAVRQQHAVDEKPVSKELQPFQGNWSIESYGSLKWPAELEEAQTWQWTIRDREITWTRPGLEPVKLSFVVDPGFTRDPKKWPSNIEFTFLDGPDKGEKCLGIFFWFADTDILWICFQDPGAKAVRPTKMGFNGYDRHTMFALKPVHSVTGPKNSETKPLTGAVAARSVTEKPIPNELQVFQGTWNFGLCDSVLWSTELDVIRKTWTWKIQGDEITWVRWGKGIVKLSFTVDPSKTPNQIDFTFLDGPQKGERCRGIYEFERNHVWVCMTEPGAKVDRPKQMEMSSESQTALIILEDKNKVRTVGAAKTATTETDAVKTDAVPAQADVPAKPVVKGPIQGVFVFESWNSENWPVKPDEFQKWQWTFQTQEIIWSRPKEPDVRLSYSVDPTASPPRIDLTFLDGPNKGQQCLGSYLWSRHQIWISFQDPGTKVDRPTDFNFKAGCGCTMMTLLPAAILPEADEINALQGLWSFSTYYSNWWPERLSKPPVDWSKWQVTVKGNEISWSGMKTEDVRLSITVDPSQSPRQIDLTFFDGPHKGKKLRGIYQFNPGNGCWICFADPDAKVDRPTEFAFHGTGHQTLVILQAKSAENPVAQLPKAIQEVPRAEPKVEDRGAEIDAAIARLRKLRAGVREFFPRGDPQYWVQIISENFDDAAMEDVETIGRGVPLNLHLKNSSVTPSGLESLRTVGHINQLELSGNNIDDAMLKILPTLPLQGQLGLYSDLVTDDGIRNVAECRQLASISLSGKLMTSPCLEHLTGLPNLRGVSLGSNFTRAAFTILGRIDGLTSLDVSQLSPDLNDLAKVPNLRRLNLSGTIYGDQAARTIADTFKSLEQAYLHDTSITNAGVEHLSRLEKLKILTLDRSKIDDGVADSIRKMKQLEWFSASDCAVADETLAAISECPNMWYLLLVNTKVTDKGIAHLVKLKKPLALYLFYCKLVTDDCIKSLAQLPNSPNLNLSLLPSGITEDGVRKLRLALPKAQIR